MLVRIGLRGEFRPYYMGRGIKLLYVRGEIVLSCPRGIKLSYLTHHISHKTT